jgi:hypothetical protein
MFATNKEVAKLVYKRVRLLQLECNRNRIESYSSSNYNIADTALVRHLALTKLRSLQLFCKITSLIKPLRD